MAGEFAEFMAENPGRARERGLLHLGRMIADGLPAPATEKACSTCRSARSIVATNESVGSCHPRTDRHHPDQLDATSPTHDTARPHQGPGGVRTGRG
jgi:hypothetical protein